MASWVFVFSKSLSSRKETQVIAVSFKDDNDPLVHNRHIGQKLQANSSEHENKLGRGSLAWFGRQTHNLAKDTNQMRNLETNGAKRPMPEVAGSNPAPGTTAHGCLSGWKCLIKGCTYCCADGRMQDE